MPCCVINSLGSFPCLMVRLTRAIDTFEFTYKLIDYNAQMAKSMTDVVTDHQYVD